MCNCQSLPGPPLSCIVRVNSYLVRFQNIKVLAVVEKIQNGCLLLPDQIAPYGESRRACCRCLLLPNHFFDGDLASCSLLDVGYPDIVLPVFRKSDLHFSLGKVGLDQAHAGIAEVCKEELL